MNNEALFWLLATLFWTLVMSFYSTQEMACISFNRLRLEYYLKENHRFARWLNYLLEHPTKLFSTTLIGVNCALMASSECARRLYEALGMNPNFAPITHIPFVLLFGELVPMFAARIYAEHMSRLGIPLLYLSSKILAPFIAVVDFFFRNISRYTGKKEEREATAFLSREELQKLIEEHESGPIPDTGEHFHEIIGNLFSLRAKRAFQLMEKITHTPRVSSHTTIAAIRTLLTPLEDKYVLVFHRIPSKIIGIALPQDLIQASDTKKVGDYISAPCFVSEHTPALTLLSQLQEEKVPIAIVLDSQGEAQGIITLDDLFDELFSSEAPFTSQKPKRLTYLEKTFSAEMPVQEFNEAYGLHIDAQGSETFAELIEQILGRNPAPGDTLFIDPIEIIVKETSLFKAKTILIRTRTAVEG